MLKKREKEQKERMEKKTFAQKEFWKKSPKTPSFSFSFLSRYAHKGKRVYYTVMDDSERGNESPSESTETFSDQLFELFASDQERCLQLVHEDNRYSKIQNQVPLSSYFLFQCRKAFLLAVIPFIFAFFRMETHFFILFANQVIGLCVKSLSLSVTISIYSTSRE